MGPIAPTIYDQGMAYRSFFDISFVTGDSPTTHDIATVLKRNAVDGFIDNFGTGDMIYQISSDGTNFGDEVYLPAGARDSLKGLSGPSNGEGMSKIVVTWVADTKYTIRVR